jgi:Mg2+ and Co2+ transporter CorA
MELIKREIEAVEQAVAQAEQHTAMIRELGDLELVVVGGGSADVHF